VDGDFLLGSLSQLDSSPALTNTGLLLKISGDRPAG
jgi:hypothetical protein